MIISDDWKIDKDKTVGNLWTTFTLTTTEPETDIDNNTILPSPSPGLQQPSSLPQSLPEQQDELQLPPPPDEPTQLGIPAAEVPEVQMNPLVDDTYQPQPDEDFQAKRARLDRQETITYIHPPTADAPTQYTAERQTHRNTLQRATPYSNKPIDDQALYQDVEVDTKNHEDTSLPPGWHIDEQGYIVLDGVQDERQTKGTYPIRKHHVPRHSAFTPEPDDCPIPLDYTSPPKRTSKATNTTHHDNWCKNNNTNKHLPETWTGSTEFNIQPTYRKLA